MFNICVSKQKEEEEKEKKIRSKLGTKKYSLKGTEISVIDIITLYIFA